MATLADMKRMVIRLLSDSEIALSSPIAGAQHSALLLQDAINAGIDAVLPWIPKASVAEIACDGAATVYDLPADCYAVDGIWDKANQTYLDDLFISPGLTADSRLAAYMEYPLNKVTFTVAPSVSGLTLYYAARWTKPALDTDVIDVPELVHMCVAIYAASYCTMARSTSTANLRQYNTNIDSGNPAQNPIADASTFLLRRFESEMNRIVPKRKGQR